MGGHKSQGLLEQERLIFEAVETIDKILIDDGVKPSLRPLQAATLFVEHFVLEVSSGNKDNYADETWFAVIYHHVKDWYDQTYGALMIDRSDGFGHAVVSVRGIPVAFDVPLTRSVVEEEGKTAWLCFPVEIEVGEDPKAWLKMSPPLANLETKELAKLEKICARTAIAMRKIQLNTQGLSGTSEVIVGLVSGIMPEVKAAAANILVNQPANFGLAAWSIQMALERTINALALQRNGTFKKTHDLFALFDLVESNLAPMRRDVMKKFLREKEVMEVRYGQGNVVERAFIFKSFLDGIEFIAAATEQLERSISVAGGKLLIRKPPWLTVPSQS